MSKGLYSLPSDGYIGAQAGIGYITQGYGAHGYGGLDGLSESSSSVDFLGGGYHGYGGYHHQGKQQPPQGKQQGEQHDISAKIKFENRIIYLCIESVHEESVHEESARRIGTRQIALIWFFDDIDIKARMNNAPINTLQQSRYFDFIFDAKIKLFYVTISVYQCMQHKRTD